MKLIIKAVQFAIKAHEGQTRKYTGEPYVVHPMAVARTLEVNGMDGDTIAAALLHDVVEDTDVTAKDIMREFGTEISNIVIGVTNPARP